MVQNGNIKESTSKIYFAHDPGTRVKEAYPLPPKTDLRDQLSGYLSQEESDQIHAAADFRLLVSYYSDKVGVWPFRQTRSRRVVEVVELRGRNKGMHFQPESQEFPYLVKQLELLTGKNDLIILTS